MVADASFCKDCGAPLGMVWIRHDLTWKPLIAAALSFVPGLGHLYRRRPFRGLGWFFGVTVAYTLNYTFGLMLHLVCAANAALAGAIRPEALAPAPTRPRPQP